MKTSTMLIVVVSTLFAPHMSDTVAADSPNSGTDRVLRGGSWYGNASLARSAYRSRGVAAHHRGNFGFRVVREVD